MVAERGSSSALWGRYLAVVEGDISRNVDFISKIDCMGSPVAEFSSSCFPFELLKEHVYAVLRRTLGDS
jgi:hypothetical protein